MQKLERKRLPGEKGFRYYLLAKAPNGGIIYNGWYTVKEMWAFPECTLSSPNALNSRIVYMQECNGDIKTLWDAVSKDKINCSATPQPKEPEYIIELCPWPAGSEAKYIR